MTTVSHYLPAVPPQRVDQLLLPGSPRRERQLPRHARREPLELYKMTGAHRLRAGGRRLQQRLPEAGRRGRAARRAGHLPRGEGRRDRKGDRPSRRARPPGRHLAHHASRAALSSLRHLPSRRVGQGRRLVAARAVRPRLSAGHRGTARRRSVPHGPPSPPDRRSRWCGTTSTGQGGRPGARWTRATVCSSSSTAAAVVNGLDRVRVSGGELDGYWLLLRTGVRLY